MRRGDIVVVDFTGSTGGEIRKIRPAIVVTANRYVARDNRVQVVPLTGNVSRLYPTEAEVIVGGQLSKAMANQLRTVAVQRIRRTVGTVTDGEMHLVEEAIAVQLSLRLAAS